MMNPCIDYCFNRFGKQYDQTCDTSCAYAKAVNRMRELEAELKKYKSEEGNLK